MAFNSRGSRAVSSIRVLCCAQKKCATPIGLGFSGVLN